jgi:hypothetical protein
MRSASSRPPFHLVSGCLAQFEHELRPELFEERSEVDDWHAAPMPRRFVEREMIIRKSETGQVVKRMKPGRGGWVEVEK